MFCSVLSTPYAGYAGHSGVTYSIFVELTFFLWTLQPLQSSSSIPSPIQSVTYNKMPQSALLLGSGFVATPAVEFLAKEGIHVTVACRTLASAQQLAANFPNTKAISLDVDDTSALEAAVAQHDVTISLIPYTHHATVIKAAIKAKKHVVTTSYVNPAMQALHEEAKAAGITVMNEIGVSRNKLLLHV